MELSSQKKNNVHKTVMHKEHKIGYSESMKRVFGSPI